MRIVGRCSPSYSGFVFSSEGKRKKIESHFFFWFGLSCEDYVRSGGSALDYRGRLVN